MTFAIQQFAPVVTQILITLAVSVTTSLLAVWLALRRFYREKWWEEKLQAYTQIIQALHAMKWDLEISIDAEYDHRPTDTDYHKRWDAKHRDAWEEIRKQIDVGDFLFSSESVAILERLSKEAGSEPDENYLEHMERTQAAVEKCMPAIKTAARKDLGLPRLKS
jgi:hypothetical protein